MLVRAHTNVNWTRPNTMLYWTHHILVSWIFMHAARQSNATHKTNTCVTAKTLIWTRWQRIQQQQRHNNSNTNGRFHSHRTFEYELPFEWNSFWAHTRSSKTCFWRVMESQTHVASQFPLKTFGIRFHSIAGENEHNVSTEWTEWNCRLSPEHTSDESFHSNDSLATVTLAFMQANLLSIWMCHRVCGIFKSYKNQYAVAASELYMKRDNCFSELQSRLIFHVLIWINQLQFGSRYFNQAHFWNWIASHHLRFIVLSRPYELARLYWYVTLRWCNCNDWAPF